MTQQRPDDQPTADENSAIDQELAHDVIQHGSDQSIPKEEQLKRAVQQHPKRELPRVESINPDEVPPRV
jgi:glycerol-3-phosphate cytidylyltransferase-like family protein